MNFLNTNVKYDDCMIVALYNAAAALGRQTTYDKIRKWSIRKKWYAYGEAFQCIYLDDAFGYLKLNAKLLPENVSTKELFKAVKDENKILIFFRPSAYGGIPGHAMVAIKGEIGVKVINPYIEDRGWRGMSEEIKSGVKHFVIEVSR